MGIFGNRIPGSSMVLNWADYKGGSQYSLSIAADISKLFVYCRNDGSNHHACNIKGLIYSDSSGQPNDLLGTTNEVAIADSQAPGWVELPFSSPVALSSATYWLCIHADADADGFYFYCDNLGYPGAYNDNTYVGGAATPFGSHTDEATRSYCIYARYPETYAFAHPGMVWTDSELSDIKDAVAGTGLQHDAYVSWVAGIETSTTSHAFAGPRDWTTVSAAQDDIWNLISGDATACRDWAYAYHCTDDTAYVTKVTNMLLSWAATWQANSINDYTNITTFDDICQVGYDMGLCIYRFAIAFDLVGSLMSGGNQTTLKTWFANMAASMWTYIPYELNWNFANEQTMTRDYEWRPSVEDTYLKATWGDRYGPACDSTICYILATLSTAYAADDLDMVKRLTTATVDHYADLQESWRSHYTAYTSIIDHALDDVLTPTNQGDYRDYVGTYAPNMLICKGPSDPTSSNPDTTDYMTYTLRMNSLAGLISKRIYDQAGTSVVSEDYLSKYSDELTASWEYLARLFAPNAVTSPVYDADNDRYDDIDYAVNKSRMPLGWAVSGSDRLKTVSITTEGGVEPADYDEVEFLGPTSMLWKIDHVTTFLTVTRLLNS